MVEGCLAKHKLDRFKVTKGTRYSQDLYILTKDIINKRYKPIWQRTQIASGLLPGGKCAFAVVLLATPNGDKINQIFLVVQNERLLSVKSIILTLFQRITRRLAERLHMKWFGVPAG